MPEQSSLHLESVFFLILGVTPPLPRFLITCWIKLNVFWWILGTPGGTLFIHDNTGNASKMIPAFYGFMGCDLNPTEDRGIQPK